MRIRAVAVVALVGAIAAGCAEESPPVVAPPLDQGSQATPAYDPDLEPAAAAMALVPADDTELQVTDFAAMRLSLGFSELTSRSSKVERARFAARAAAQEPLLGPSVLQPVDDQLRERYGFGQDDVEWEARFSGPSGEGWAIKLRDDLAPDGVQDAIDAGVGPLAGTQLFAGTRVVLNGGTTDPSASWMADPELFDLVGQVAVSTYVSRSCVPSDVALRGASVNAAPPDLDDLGPFSVSFGDSLITARLGELREDVFDRAELAETASASGFDRAYANAVADPQGGRIGYRIGDGPAAATLARQQQLPFAVCAT